MTERWLPVHGWEGLYEISDQGRARSLDRSVIDSRGRSRRFSGQVRIPTLASGYPRIAMTRMGVREYRAIHVMVLETFVGLRPDGMEACHSDDNKLNNNVSNLRWDTQSENAKDIVRHGYHRLSSRTQCPREHPLESPNLRVKSSGHKECLSCARARSRQKNRPGQDFKSIADEVSAEIMAKPVSE